MPNDEYPFNEATPEDGSPVTEPSSVFFRWLKIFFNNLEAGPVAFISKDPSGHWTIPDGSTAATAIVEEALLEAGIGAFDANPFAVNVVLNSGTGNYEVSLNSSTIQGEIKSMANKTSGSGDIWGTVTITDTTGVVSAPTLTSGATAPASSATTIIWPIAWWDFPSGGGDPTAGNYRYGPLAATSERLYYINPAEWAFNPN